MGLVKAIEKALDERRELFWEYFWNEEHSRTVIDGFALWAVVAYQVCGRNRNRRLYVLQSKETVKELNAGLVKRIEAVGGWQAARKLEESMLDMFHTYDDERKKSELRLKMRRIV